MFFICFIYNIFLGFRLVFIRVRFIGLFDFCIFCMSFINIIVGGIFCCFWGIRYYFSGWSSFFIRFVIFFWLSFWWFFFGFVFFYWWLIVRRYIFFYFMILSVFVSFWLIKICISWICLFCINYRIGVGRINLGRGLGD